MGLVSADTKEPKVLVISRFFPPAGGGGVVRVHSFVKYLPAFGWLPVVLTVKDEYNPAFIKDASLLQEYDNGVIIYCTNSFEPKGKLAQNVRANVYGAGTTPSFFFQKFGKVILRQLYHALIIPDEYLLWLPYALKEGLNLIEQHAVSAIFATTPPHSVGMMAALLSHLSKKPLVLDVRDDWVDNPAFDTGPLHKRWLARLLERWVVKKADRILCVTPGSVSLFQRKYPRQPANKFLFFPNGFDPQSIPKITSTNDSQPSDKLRIIYIGSLPSKRTPLYLFQALQELNQELSLEQLLQVDFYGYARRDFFEAGQQMGLDKVVTFHGYVSRLESLKQLALSNAGLIILPEDEGGMTAYTGKIFEYIGAEKFVLALCPPDSAVAQLVEEANLGLAVPHNRVEAIKSAIKQMLARYQQRQLAPKLLPDFVARFDRSAQTRQLAVILTKMTDRRG